MNNNPWINTKQTGKRLNLDISIAFCHLKQFVNTSIQQALEIGYEYSQTHNVIRQNSNFFKISFDL